MMDLKDPRGVTAPSGASRWLIIGGIGALIVAAAALIAAVLPMSPWLPGEGAMLIPLVFVVFCALALGGLVAGLVVDRARAGRQPRL